MNILKICRTILVKRSNTLVIIVIVFIYVTIYLCSTFVLMSSEDQSSVINSSVNIVDIATFVHKYVLGFPIGFFFLHRDDYYLIDIYIILANIVLMIILLLIMKKRIA